MKFPNIYSRCLMLLHSHFIIVQKSLEHFVLSIECMFILMYTQRMNMCAFVFLLFYAEKERKSEIIIENHMDTPKLHAIDSKMNVFHLIWSQKQCIQSNISDMRNDSSSAFFTIFSIFLAMVFDWFMECQLIFIHVADFKFVSQISSTFPKYSMHLEMENYDSYSAIPILEKRKQNEMILRKYFACTV